jgi:purine catabolism regulator
MLGPLFLRDAMDGGDRVRTLGAYLRYQRNKSLTAQELGVSRPTLYERLARIQRLLRVDLDDPEWSTSLYAAIMVVEAAAADPATPSPRATTNR